ncbi:MAG: PLP-dependent aminotransferase family protein [Candidatus Adiutrix sp.]|jgi:2-aminoadipate transaminase|nr:PLP-dependent aminotransferase family protein [Candidatus Adiutrix sp.]
MTAFSNRIPYMREAADVVRILFESLSDPGTISFGGGAPAKEMLPVDEVAAITKDILTKEAQGYPMLQYGNPMGFPALRQAVVEHLLVPGGLPAKYENIIISSGGMEGVSLAGHLYLDPGDVVLVESPTFVQSLETFQFFQANIVAVETDDHGFVIEALEDNIKKHHPKLIYVIPTFQNPSGRTTTLERRKAIAELASRYDVMVLEDDPYFELRYSGQALPPVKSFDKTGHVMYANSFSKIFAPGCRLGYVYAEKEIVDRMYDVKTALNSMTTVLPQVICAEFFNRGLYPGQLKRNRAVHCERRDAMMNSLSAHMPEGVTWVYPDGGLFTWAQLPGGLSSTDLLPEIMAAGVTYLPGRQFFAEGQPILDNCMRLSFGQMPPEVIDQGIQKMAKVIKSKLR